MNTLDDATISAALKDLHGKVRAAGIRLSERAFKQNPTTASALSEKLVSFAADTSTDVQIQLALSLGSLPQTDKAKAALVGLAKGSGLVRDAAAYTLAAFEPVKAEASLATAARALTPEEKVRFDAGKAMYEATCLACHQVHGMGQIGLAPPLVGSEWVAGSESRLIRIVIHGLRGPIKVKGESYEMDMPALGVLDDEQISAALTYVRREWGHGYEPVTPAAVKKVRDETATREDAWTMADLLKIP